MQFLGRDERKTLGKVEPHLMAEDRKGAGARAIRLGHALVENAAEEIVIGLHGSLMTARPDAAKRP
jgi:hypothetical protein